MAVADYLLVCGAMCFINPGGQLMACVIEDDDLAAATKAYLRRAGVPEYDSFNEYRAAQPV